MSKKFFIISLILLGICFIAFILIPNDAPNFLWAILGLILFISWFFLLISFITFIISKINQKKYSKPKENFSKIENTETKEKLSTEISDNLTEEKTYFRMEAKRKYLILTNIGGTIGGILLIYFLLLLRGLFNFYTFTIGIIIVIFYMLYDYINWQKKGIRIVEIDEKGINLYIGKEKALKRILLDQITDIDFFSKAGRRIINIILGGNIMKPIPGVTLFSGPRIRITDDSFNDKEFTTFIDKLKEIVKK